MKYKNVREEEIKNSVATDFFDRFDCDKIIGFIDFAVKLKRSAGSIDFGDEYLLWAEAKTGNHDVYAMFTQLVLTIGKARTFDKVMPPPFLGCFDGEKIAFVPYSEIQNIFYQNDFNWKVTPSNTETKEFQQVYNQLKKVIDKDTMIFDFERDEKDLQQFIKQNFIVGKIETTKIKIDKNNFIIIYNKWLQTVKPSIDVNWDLAKKNGIIDGDFYLADLLSLENKTIKDKLSVILGQNQYELDKHKNKAGLFTSSHVEFNDNQKAHNSFWNRYERPPREEYWDYIVERRDLLVPQDVRERKGSFFTPQIWVELSQKYIADVFGEDWQDEYYVWDCAAGTGNLLVGLINKDNIWASTLDKQDVNVMHDRIDNGAILWKEQAFQFDFLNDDFTPVSKGGKLPDELYNIISNEERRKKLIIYINPPYAEHGDIKQKTKTGRNKEGVATITNTHKYFSSIAGTATRELFAQFFLRIFKEIPDVKLASFSKLKFINSQNFLKFRQYFKAEYKKGFICKANTFDNVKGNFPIGFLIWDMSNKQDITKVEMDVILERDNKTIYWKESTKSFYSFATNDFISGWLREFYDKRNDAIGHLILPGVDFQAQNGVYITSRPTESDVKQHKTATITKNNLLEMSIYLAVRKVIPATWLNDRDQFLYPNDRWKTDTEFQNDCLAYTLFNNNIQSQYGVNQWIPFTEAEVSSQRKFESRFMTDFINGKLKQSVENTLFPEVKESKKLEFSAEAQAVFSAGKELWKYYHAQPNCNVNASLYDIREHFQGRNDKGKMNARSDDERYTELIADLRDRIKVLAKKIEPKVYEYGFLK
ncbi:MAG: hypothetical protein LBQ84_03455 [Flavobacteriaceae bacterium]|nr:hypothetical protein [Flavobacteriaceae bacterium]